LPGVWESNHVRCFWVGIKPSHFNNRLWHFRIGKPTFEMPCNENGPLVSPVIQSDPPLRQSRMGFLLRFEGFMCFHHSLCACLLISFSCLLIVSGQICLDFTCTRCGPNLGQHYDAVWELSA